MVKEFLMRFNLILFSYEINTKKSMGLFPMGYDPMNQTTSKGNNSWNFNPINQRSPIV
jgi:hypothetical protein